jgi:NitT/TauT family transport system substrate-binding protein
MLRQFIRYFTILLNLSLCLLVLTGEAVSQSRFKVVYNTITPPSAPLWIAKEKGFFEKYGISVDLVFIESGPRSVQALLSGDALVTTTAGPAVANAKVSGAEVIMIAGLVNVFPFFLVSHPGIDSPSALAGKTGATQVFGSGGDLALRMALRSLGLDPERDVKLRVIGSSSLRVQAIDKRLVDFAMLEPMVAFQGQKSNLNILVDFTERRIPYQHSGIITLESSLKRNRPQILSFLKATLEGLSFYKRNKEESLNIMAKYTRLGDRAVLATSYEWFKKVFPDVPYATPEGFKTILDMIYINRKGASPLDPKTLVDRTLLDTLANDGFIQSLNTPSR